MAGVLPPARRAGVARRAAAALALSLALAPLAAMAGAPERLGAPAPAAAAQPCKPKTSLGDIEDEVMCVVCGSPLYLVPDAPQAIRERALIERLIGLCLSKEQVKARLVAEFGPAVLATPDDGGFDLAAYLVPGLAVVLGGGGVAIAAARWRRRRAPGAGSAPPATLAAPPDPRLQRDIDRYEL